MAIRKCQLYARAVPGSHHRIPAYIEFFYDDDTQGLPYRVTPAGIPVLFFFLLFLCFYCEKGLETFRIDLNRPPPNMTKTLTL